MENFLRSYYLDPQVCDNIISWFDSNPQLHEQGVVGNEHGAVVDLSVKNATCINFDLGCAYNVDNNISSFLDFLWQSVCFYVSEFEELSRMSFSMTEGFHISKYSPPDGGFLQDHCERNDVSSASRLLVWMLYLTSNGLAGGTNFKYLNHDEPAEKGKLLIWPTDFTHTHKSIVDTTQPKYIITGWYNLVDI